MFLGTLKYNESDEQYCFSKKKNCEVCIFGFQIYLFVKAHSNGLSNKFIPILPLITPPPSPPPKKECLQRSWAVPINTAIETRMFF